MRDAGNTRPIGFPEAVRRGFTRYATFSGRASRPEFWWWVLFAAVANAVANLVSQSTNSVAGLVVALVLLCPNIAVTVRRLHDTDKSGWWFLLGLIPFFGWVIIVFLCIQESTPGKNRFGPPSN